MATLVAFAGAAQTLKLDGQLDDTSRWYDYFSDAYAEISLDEDGFYQIDNVDTQYGSYDVFPTEGAIDLGTLTYDGSALTGAGAETAPVTGLEFSLDQTVDTSHGPYTTELADLSGSVAFVDGVAASVSLEAGVTFTFTTGLLTGADFVGTLAIVDNVIALDADKTHDTLFGPLRYRWDLTGRLSMGGDPPPVGAPPVLTISKEGENTSIVWAGMSGLTYQLQSSDTLSPADWADVGEPQHGNGDEIVVELGTEAAHRFFRVVVVGGE